MNRKIKQCWSSIPLITTKRTIASYLNWTHWTRKETTINDVTNQGLCLGQAKNVTELNRLMGSQPNHLDNWISNCNAYTMYKQTIKKTCTDSVPLKNMSTAHACVWSLYFTTHNSNSSLYSDILHVAIFWVLTCKLRIFKTKCFILSCKQFFRRYPSFVEKYYVTRVHITRDGICNPIWFLSWTLFPYYVCGCHTV